MTHRPEIRTIARKLNRKSRKAAHQIPAFRNTDLRPDVGRNVAVMCPDDARAVAQIHKHGARVQPETRQVLHRQAFRRRAPYLDDQIETKDGKRKEGCDGYRSSPSTDPAHLMNPMNRALRSDIVGGTSICTEPVISDSNALSRSKNQQPSATARRRPKRLARKRSS